MTDTAPDAAVQIARSALYDRKEPQVSEVHARGFRVGDRVHWLGSAGAPVGTVTYAGPRRRNQRIQVLLDRGMSVLDSVQWFRPVSR